MIPRVWTAVAILVGWSVVSFSTPVEAAPCTDGVDCYCDRVKNPSDPIFDGQVLMCEDWEAPALHDDVFTDGLGPWYSNSGVVSYYRGGGNWWNRTYGSVTQGCAWRDGMPANPIVGQQCGANICGPGEWRADDRWQANSFACIDIIQQGEGNDETPTSPTDPFDGKQSFAHRINAGWTSGIKGTKSFSCKPDCKEIGYTEAIAYSSNIAGSRILDAPWKHDEWGSQNQHWTHGLTGTGGSGAVPYKPFLWTSGGLSACESALSKATISRGSAQCRSVGLIYGASGAHYNQANDWPWGTWGCSQAYIKGIGSSNLSLRLWHNGVLIFEMTGFDGRVLKDSNGFKSFTWNAYANQNQEGAPTIGVVRRFQDNIHIRQGPPVSCANIGFGGSPGSPSPPSGGDPGDPNAPLGAPGQPTISP